ncbi:hypothetical protein KSS87_002001, partial [Heliosperma pusillum]
YSPPVQVVKPRHHVNTGCKYRHFFSQYRSKVSSPRHSFCKCQQCLVLGIYLVNDVISVH